WHLQPGDHPHDRALRSGVRPRQRLRRPLRRGDREHPRAPRAVHACRRLHHVALPRPPLRARAGAAAPQLPARAAGAGGRREADADSDRGVAARPRDPLRVRVVSLRRDRPLYPAPSRARLRLAGRAQAVRRDRPARPRLERAASGPRRGAPARGQGEHPRLRHPAGGRLDRRRARRARMAASPRRLRPARAARRGRARAAGARPLAIAAGRVRAAARPAVRPGRGRGARRPARAGEVSVVGERGALSPASLLRRAEQAIATTRGACAVAAAALAVYALESVALPVIPGRDFGTYLRFYVQMWDWHSVWPMTMLFRTPVAPLVVGGSLDLLGGWGTHALMALLFAASVLAWTRVALAFGRRAALLVAASLVLYPGYGILFHELASDSITAAAFAGFALVLARASAAPRVSRFALVGVAVAVAALTRPGNQALVLAAAVPLAVAARWRDRLASAAACAGAALALLGAWAVCNGIRYDDYSVARGGKAYLPFFRAFTRDHIVEP